MILDSNNTVQPETTFTLSHKRAICDEATCTCINSITWSNFIIFWKWKTFDPPGSSNKTLTRSGLIAIHTLFNCTNTANDVTITSSKTTRLPTRPYPQLDAWSHTHTHTTLITTEYFGHCWHKNICVFPRQLQAGACFLPASECLSPSWTLLYIKYLVDSRMSYWRMTSAFCVQTWPKHDQKRFISQVCEIASIQLLAIIWGVCIIVASHHATYL